MHAFQTFIMDWYKRYGRHDLPWRLTHDPYAILVSELMLQQTQVSRVVPKYQTFLARFPNLASLAAATLSEVLTLWQGLGYNRRARYLFELSQRTTYLPQTEAELQQLPGIGSYTAAAICAFAYNQPVTLIETNIRSVFLYHFFAGQTQVTDKEILPCISEYLHRQRPREWYWALMDYGAYLKTVLPNPSRLSKHHIKQSKFAGSLRQVRGQILKLLLQAQHMSADDLKTQIKTDENKVEQALLSLVKDKLIAIENDSYSIYQK